MADVTLESTTRTEFGKGSARRLRREQRIPAVVYGHGGAVRHIAIPAHATTLALRQSNVLFSLIIDGKPQLAVAKDVQRNPVRQIIEHIDFQAVRAGEMIEIEVPVIVVGESVSGTIHVVETQQLTVMADASNLPQSVEVSVEGLEDGSVVTAGDVVLPKGVVLVTPAEHTVVMVTEPRAEAADVEADEAAAEAAE